MATHPIQYQAPLWRALARRDELCVHVFYGSDLSVRGYWDEGFGVQVRWDLPLTEGYEHTFLARDKSIQRIGFWKPKADRLRSRLRAFNPNVVLLTAYNSVFWIRALLTSRILGYPVVLRHEASDAATNPTRHKRLLRDTVLKLYYSQITSFAVIGTEARRHLHRLGVPAAKMVWAPYCVDSKAMECQVKYWLPKREVLRRELGIGPDDFVLIFSGKLTEKKQPLLVPRALTMLSPAQRERVHWIVMGDGEQRAQVETEGRAVLGSRLHMTGFVNQSELGRWYAVADSLVLPSKRGAGETWGLVVNEAMQCGLTGIVSDGVGCRDDLIDITTGIVFASTSIVCLAHAILQFAGEPMKLRMKRRELVRERVEKFSLQRAEEGLFSAVMAASNEEYKHNAREI